MQQCHVYGVMHTDRIPTKKEPCLTPTLMDEGQAKNLIQPTMGIKWNSGSLP